MVAAIIDGLWVELKTTEFNGRGIEDVFGLVGNADIIDGLVAEPTTTEFNDRGIEDVFGLVGNGLDREVEGLFGPDIQGDGLTGALTLAVL